MAQPFFISYASEDVARAREICALLTSLGAPYWIAPESILPGEPYPVAIAKAIRECCAVLLLFSHSSDQSEDVLNEINVARNHKKRVVPIRLENLLPVTLEYYLGVPQWIDLYDPENGEGRNRLKQLVAEVFGAGAPTDPNRTTAKTDTGTASILPAVSSLNPGDRLGPWDVLELLASGGMGLVYRARLASKGRIDAVWVLHPEFGADQELMDLCRGGIQLQASLHHSNIPAVYALFSVGPRPAMIMEYVDGPALETLVRKGPIAPADVMRWATHVLAALSYVHAHAMVHRNLKPETMLLTPTGEATLTGFHVACLRGASRMRDGRVIGSMCYMSPEQIRGEEPDARSDIYSLGVALFEMVTGQCPFQGPSEYAIMQGHLQRPAPAAIDIVPSLPSGLNDVILMAMAKRPEARFASADAMRNALAPSVKAARL